MVKVEIQRGSLLALYAVWGIPVVSFISEPSYEPRILTTGFAFLATFLITLANSRIRIIALPLVAMITPLGSDFRIGGLLLSEVYLIYCILFSITTILSRGTLADRPKGALDNKLIILLFIVFASYLLSFEYSDLFPAVLNWLSLAAIYLLTRSALRNRSMIDVYLISFIVTAVYASALIISAYHSSIALSYFLINVERINFAMLVWGDDLFFRSSYMYTNALFFLGAANVTAIVLFFLSANGTRRLLWLGVSVEIFIALLYMLTKTGIFAVLLTIVVLWWLNGRAFNSKVKQFDLIIAISFVVAISLLALLLWKVVEMISDAGGLGSFGLRLDVFSSVLEVLLSTPARIIIGYGPDSSIRLESALIDLAKQSGEGTEGAIDSTYMTLLFEYGLPFLAIVLSFLYRILSRLYLFIVNNKNSVEHGQALVLFGIVVFFAICGITQSVGTSKVAWIVAQLIGFADVYASKQISKLEVQNA